MQNYSEPPTTTAFHHIFMAMFTVSSNYICCTFDFKEFSVSWVFLTWESTVCLDIFPIRVKIMRKQDEGQKESKAEREG